MFTETIIVNNITIELQRENPNKTRFSNGILQIKFFKLYPEVSDFALGLGASNVKDETVRSDVEAKLKNENPLLLLMSMGPLDDILHFISFFNHVKRIDYKFWPKYTDTIDKINRAFEWFLENPEIWETCWPIIERLETPNGKEGLPEVLLTDEEKQDSFLDKKD